MYNITIPTYTETERLVLKKFEYEHAPNILKLISTNSDRLKEAGVITDSVLKILTIEDAEKYIKKMNLGWMLKTIFTFGLWAKENNELIGEYKIFNINKNDKSAETGGFLDINNEGRFYIQEITPYIDKILFEIMSFDKMFVSCRKNNIVSKFGLDRSKYFRKIKEGDSILVYEMTKENYFNNNKK